MYGHASQTTQRCNSLNRDKKMSKTYSRLFPQVVTEINKRIGKNILERIRPVDNLGYINSRDLSKILSFISDVNDLIEPHIITGLDATATVPPSASIKISAGSGVSHGRKWKIDSVTTLIIPFDSTTSVFYVVVYDDAFEINRTHDDTKCEVCKIVVPKPGTTVAIVDDNPDDGYDGWIVSAKDVLYDEDLEFDDNTMQKLREFYGVVDAGNITGVLRLSEGLKISNTAGTLSLNSNSLKLLNTAGLMLAKFDKNGVYFFDEHGVEKAHFGAVDAKIGNIRINQNSIQSDNYVANSAGFIIQDNGDAQFNNIRLRGTIYTSTISENIYISPGVKFIGDLTFLGSISIDADTKFYLDGSDGDTYWMYNSVTQYLECWVDGGKRVEL